MTAAVEQINKLFKEIEELASSHSPYLAGKDITAADILLSVIANWTGFIPKPIHIGPNTKKLLKNVIARAPATRRRWPPRRWNTRRRLAASSPFIRG